MPALHPLFGRITPVEQGVALVYDTGDLIATLESEAIELRRENPLWQQRIPGKHLILRHATDISDRAPLRDPLPRTHASLVEHVRRYNREVGRLATAGIRTLPCSQFVVEHDPGAHDKSVAGVYTVVPKYGPGHRLENANWDHIDVQQTGIHVAASLLRYFAPRTGHQISELEGLEQYADDGTCYEHDPWVAGRRTKSLQSSFETRRSGAITEVKGWVEEFIHKSPSKRALLAAADLLLLGHAKDAPATIKTLLRGLWRDEPGIDWSPLGHEAEQQLQ